MLRKELKNKINIIEKVENWEDAIRTAAKPLLENFSINKSYIDAMINNIKKFGTYIVVAPKVAMPHSRPEDGVNKNCLALLKINNGVFFDENTDEEDKVYLIFILGAVDNSSHINTLTNLMDIIDDEEKIDALVKAKTVDEMINLI